MNNLNKTDVDLGFTEECEPWLLTNKYFPSKVGGKPAWLELENIPTQNELKCLNCEEACILLCQVYAPKDDDYSFHRTIFLFICKNEKCCQPNSAKNILVFRSQLPRENKFYSFTSPDEKIKSDEIKSPVILCDVCGCRGPLSCSKCKSSYYCGKLHQKIDWKNGHKIECAKTTDSSVANYLFPQFELVIEPEELEVKVKENKDEAEKRRLKEYENLVSEGKTGELKDVNEEEFTNFSATTEDSMFTAFMKRIDINQDQVLRYQWNGEPLWITTDNILKHSDVPNCENCNSKRCFEFQIMPQLLNTFNEVSLDWGVITVYSCSNSCDIKSKYIKEFVYKQDFIKENEDEQTKINK